MQPKRPELHQNDMPTMNQIGRESWETAAAKGFDTIEPQSWDDSRHLIPTKLALVHSEVSEALEEFRKGHNLDKFYDELADIVIRVGQLGYGLGGDLDAAIEKKQAANRLREHRHGGRII